MIRDVQNLRQALVEARKKVSDSDYEKAKELFATQEAMDKEEKERQGGRHAAADAELEQVDGFDNSLHTNLAKRKLYV